MNINIVFIIFVSTNNEYLFGLTIKVIKQR